MVSSATYARIDGRRRAVFSPVVVDGMKGRVAKANFKPLGSKVTYTKEELAATWDIGLS